MHPGGKLRVPGTPGIPGIPGFQVYAGLSTREPGTPKYPGPPGPGYNPGIPGVPDIPRMRAIPKGGYTRTPGAHRISGRVVVILRCPCHTRGPGKRYPGIRGYLGIPGVPGIAGAQIYPGVRIHQVCQGFGCIPNADAPGTSEHPGPKYTRHPGYTRVAIREGVFTRVPDIPGSKVYPSLRVYPGPRSSRPWGLGIPGP